MRADPRKSFVYRAVRRALWPFMPEAARTALVSAEILEFEKGHYLSAKVRKSVDAQGAPLPWLTYPALDCLSQWDLKGLRVFEFGAGGSTAYWLNRGAAVCGVEHDSTWHGQVLEMTGGRVDLRLRTAAEYPAAIDEFDGQFDIILVDGEQRPECVRRAPSKLKQNGLIILDNADWFPGAASFLRSLGYVEVDFYGASPINGCVSSTSFFLGRGFCPVSMGDRQPASLPGTIPDVLG